MAYRFTKIAANALVAEVQQRYRPVTPGAFSTDEAIATVSAGGQFMDLPTDTLNAVSTLAAIELEAAEGEEVRWEVRH